MRKELGALSLVAMAALIGCGPNNADDAITTDDTTTADATTADDADVATDDPAMTTDDAAATGAESFVTDAAKVNLLEIETSTLAETNAQRPEVQDFARMMVSDHTAANEALLQAAGSMPSASMTLDAAAQSKVDELRETDPASFDAAYLDLQVEAHENAVALFEAYNPDGTNPELDAFVAQTLPTLREHLDEVRALRTGAAPGDDAMGAGTGEDDMTIPPDTSPPDDVLPPDTTTPEGETTPPTDDPTN